MAHWVCDDCGEKILLSRLDEINTEREAKGISIKARFVNCKGMGKHIPGVAGMFFYLTEKGQRVYDAVNRFLDEIEDIEVQTLEDSSQKETEK